MPRRKDVSPIVERLVDRFWEWRKEHPLCTLRILSEDMKLPYATVQRFTVYGSVTVGTLDRFCELLEVEPFYRTTAVKKKAPKPTKKKRRATKKKRP